MNLLFKSRVASTRLFCLLGVLLGAGWPSWAAAQALASPAANGSVAATDAGGAGGDANAPPQFGIDLQTTPQLKAFLLRHMDLQRYQALADLDSRELDRLLEQAPQNLRDLLGTLGYFSPEVTTSRAAAEVTNNPASAAARNAKPPPPLGTVRLEVVPGPLTRVGNAQVYFERPLSDAAQTERIQRTVALAQGLTFTQADWSRIKSEALRELTAERYAQGRVANSLADIDAKQNIANLYLELDPGPRVRIGEVRVEGAERYGRTTAARLVRLNGLTPGADYSLDKLQAAQQRIADTGYYNSVFAYVDLNAPSPDAETADAANTTTSQPSAPAEVTAPVVVQVREGLPQKIVLGVGGSTDNGPRLSAEYTHLQVPALGWRASAKLQWERNDQLLATDWTAPVEESGWHWLAGARAAKQIDGDTSTDSERASVGRSKEDPLIDRRYFVQFDRARTVNPTVASASSNGIESAISLNYGWTRRRFANLPFPNDGHGLGVVLGVGTTLANRREPFVNAQARWLGFWPLGKTIQPLEQALQKALGRAQAPATEPTSGPWGRLALRLQGGAVLTADNAPIPDTLLFLTGGDNTVRGYGLRDIGIEQADGSVSAGRYLAVASLEWQKPLFSKGQRTPWEAVVFTDAGTVANRPGDLKALLGVGAGVRYNSPVGPMQLDLAYGLEPQRFRVHLNVGFSF